MKKLALLACGFVAACNFDTGECYLRSEDGAGAGGGAIVPTGYGGFGDVAPEPQGAPSPVDPCLQKAECTITWKADSAVCKERGTSGTCTSYYQGNHSTLSEAQSECARISGPGAESCGSCHWVTVTPAKTCTDMFDACHDKGKPCTREIDPGLTLCAICRDDCQAKRSYKFSECYSCGFE